VRAVSEKVIGAPVRSRISSCGLALGPPPSLTAMRTYVRDGNPPFRPINEIEHELNRGKLKTAMAIAKDMAGEQGRPISLHTAARFLAVVATRQPGGLEPVGLSLAGAVAQRRSRHDHRQGS
jgi:hypothetical protein